MCVRGERIEKNAVCASGISSISFAVRGQRAALARARSPYPKKKKAFQWFAGVRRF